MKTSEAIEHFGSKIKIARALNVAPAAVTQWGEEVPRGRACELQILTRGKLKAFATGKNNSTAS